MGNAWACTRWPRGKVPSLMRGSSSAKYVAAIAAEGAPSSSSMSLLGRPSMKSIAERVVHRMAKSGSDTSSIEQCIEESRTHWSILAEPESYFDEEKVVEDNKKVFAALQSHPTRGKFFYTFGYDTEVSPHSGSLVIGEKFAEGGQAELFHAKVIWKNPRNNEADELEEVEWVLKVFKKGTLLRQLQSQWPEGMFQYNGAEREIFKAGAFPRFFCDVHKGVLLEDGRFAFLMKKEMFDLCSLTDQGMKMITGKNQGPFKKEDVEWIMFCIAVGVSWLHSHDIVHRDLKASNVLVRVYDDGYFQCYVADYECSIGVVGTNFFRAPEILMACKDKNVSERPELFTMLSDIYSYGMTCYEILTGKLPFDDHPVHDYDIVLNGGDLEVPTYVDGWIRELLYRCWQANPSSRPSFGEIANLILANSKHVREIIEQEWSIRVYEIDWIKWET